MNTATTVIVRSLDIFQRLREDIRIFRQVRQQIETQRIVDAQRAIDAAAAQANLTPEKIVLALKAIRNGYEYVRRDHIAQEMALDVDLMLAHEVLRDAVLSKGSEQ